MWILKKKNYVIFFLEITTNCGLFLIDTYWMKILLKYQLQQEI